MKKILFVTSQLLIGGTETALLETVKLLKAEDVDITVAVFKPGGELFNTFTEYCNVNDLSNQYSKALITKNTIIQNIKSLRIFSAIRNLWIKVSEKYFVSHFKFKENISNRMPEDPNEYDIAVAYSAPYTSSVPYVLDKISAKRKLAWIHFDVADYIKEIDVSDFSDCYERLDKIICVSEASKKSFVTRHPSLKEKTTVAYNPIDTAMILYKAQESVDTNIDNKLAICSVGRLTYDKGIDISICAHKLLKDNGYNVKWLVCGEGDYRSALEENIKESGLENDFILLGNQKNPYKYMNAADIYVQTSRTESYCLTLAEARVLKKPIVTTNIPTATEHVTNGYNGYICDMDAESVANAIEQLINSPELRQKFSENTNPIDCDNSALKKLFE